VLKIEGQKSNDGLIPFYGTSHVCLKFVPEDKISPRIACLLQVANHGDLRTGLFSYVTAD